MDSRSLVRRAPTNSCESMDTEWHVCKNWLVLNQLSTEMSIKCRVSINQGVNRLRCHCEHQGHPLTLYRGCLKYIANHLALTKNLYQRSYSYLNIQHNYLAIARLPSKPTQCLRDPNESQIIINNHYINIKI